MTACTICSETIPDGDIAMIDGLPFCPKHDEGGKGMEKRVLEMLWECAPSVGAMRETGNIVAALVAALADVNASLELCKENFTNYANTGEDELTEANAQAAFHSQRADDNEKELAEERALVNQLQMRLTEARTPHFTGAVYDNR